MNWKQSLITEAVLPCKINWLVQITWLVVLFMLVLKHVTLWVILITQLYFIIYTCFQYLAFWATTHYLMLQTLGTDITLPKDEMILLRQVLTSPFFKSVKEVLLKKLMFFFFKGRCSVWKYIILYKILATLVFQLNLVTCNFAHHLLYTGGINQVCSNKCLPFSYSTLMLAPIFLMHM